MLKYKIIILKYNIYFIYLIIFYIYLYIYILHKILKQNIKIEYKLKIKIEYLKNRIYLKYINIFKNKYKYQNINIYFICKSIKLFLNVNIYKILYIGDLFKIRLLLIILKYKKNIFI